MQVQFLGQEDPLEKEMQPTPVFLSGKSHGQVSLAGFQSMGSQRSRTQLSDQTTTNFFFLIYKEKSWAEHLIP